MIGISIIIPVYNGNLYLDEALLSAFQKSIFQTEIIFIDDGSFDGSELIAYSIEAKNYTVIHQRNKGLFQSRLVGILAARYDYCMFLDCDDTLNPHAIDIIGTYIKEKDPDVLMYRFVRFWKNGKTKEQSPAFQSEHFIPMQEAQRLLYSSNRINPFVLKCFKKNLISPEYLKNIEKITIGEDGLLTAFLFQNTNKLFYIDDILYNYRMVDGSMARSFDANSYNSNKSITQEMLKIVKQKDNNGKQEYVDGIYKKYFKKIASIALYGKFKIGKYKNEYTELLKQISEDELFISAYKSEHSNLSLVVKIPVFMIYKRMYMTLYVLKKILTPILIER